MANDTIDKITSWASQKYAVAPTPATGVGAASGGGMLSAAATAAPTATSGNTGMLATATPATPAGPSADVSSWYKSALNRTPGQSELDYWQGAIDKGMDRSTAYSMFQASASQEATKALGDAMYKSKNPTAPAAPAAPSAPAAPGATGATAARANVSDWYRAKLGRDGDKAGIEYWQKAIDGGMDVNEAYSMFEKSAASNQEQVKAGVDLAQANAYKGPTSGDASTIVDDWGRNVLNRDLSAAEKATWDSAWRSAKTPAESQAVYKAFLEANKGSIVRNLDQGAASQIAPNVVKPQDERPTWTNPGYNPGIPIDNGLTMRGIDQPTETVQGQLQKILAADNPVMQQARAEGMRTAFDRGLGNSSIAASAGADALIRAAAGIATTDSGYYNKAADYNVAAKNELFMYDRDQVNQFKRLEAQLGSEAAARAMQVDLAKMQDATSRYNTDTNAATNKYNTDTSAATQAAAQAQQMTIAQMNDATQKIQIDMNAANNRYNTDMSFKQAIDTQRQSIANNIIANMEMSPDRKAAMLESLGFGTSTKYGDDGVVVPGSGLAGAVYVIDSTSDDLNFAGPGSNDTSYRNRS